MSPDTETLKRSFLFCGLKPDEIEQVSALATYQNLSVGEHLTELGESDSDLFVILGGHAVVNTHDGDKLADLGPGSIAGEVAFLDAQPRTAYIVCVDLLTVARFPAVELRKYLSANRSVGFTILANLARVLTCRLRSADLRLDDLLDAEGDVWHHCL